MRKNRLFLFFVISFVSLGMSASAQIQKAQDPSTPAVSSSTDSVRPFFYCDQNKDGICDYCGRPAGSGAAWRTNGTQLGTFIGGRAGGRGQDYGYGRKHVNRMGRGYSWRQSKQAQTQQ